MWRGRAFQASRALYKLAGKNPHLANVQGDRHRVADVEGPASRLMGIIDQNKAVPDLDGVTDDAAKEFPVLDTAL